MSPITAVPVTAAIQAPKVDSVTSTQQSGGEFQSLLNSAIQNVSSAQNNANSAVQSFLSGETDEVHSTILATQRADLEFDMFMQVRNKVVSAYQEIMRMQV